MANINIETLIGWTLMAIAAASFVLLVGMALRTGRPPAATPELPVSPPVVSTTPLEELLDESQDRVILPERRARRTTPAWGNTGENLRKEG